ncbi:hypothetical protein D3C72_1617360 [compost metagenome]
MIHDPRHAILGHVLHEHEHVARTNGQVHCTPDGSSNIGHSQRPVRQVAIGSHLIGAQYAIVKMATAHHGKGICVVKVAATIDEPYRQLGGIGNVRVRRFTLPQRAHAENAILAMDDDLVLRAPVFQHLDRQANAEIDVRSGGNVPGYLAGHRVATEPFYLHGSPLSTSAMRTTRCTKIPGVTTDSGSRSPRPTRSRT